MRISALGRFEVVIGGHGVRLGGPQQRLVLAMLVTQPNRFVPADELIDGLWGEEVPGRPRKTLQVYVANLRRALGDAGGDGRWILSEPSGYRLAIDRTDVDLHRFEELLDSASRHRATAADKSLALYREALALWRGEPFADLPGRHVLLPTVARLCELRLAALEDQTALRLECEPHTEAAVVAELEQLCREHPWREGLWAQLIRALYRAGRATDALEAYQRLRHELAEIGVEPSPAVRDLERQVLQHDPALSTTSTQPTTSTQRPRARRTTNAERRSVTVLAAGLVPAGATQPEPEDVVEALEPFHAAVADVVTRNGGVVDRARHGEVVAYFGLGNDVDAHAHADAAVRAAHEAVEHRSPPALGVTVGIHTDLAVVEPTGEPGAPWRVSGAGSLVAVQLRSRAAAGEVVMSEDTAALLTRDVVTQLPAHGLIGRERELERLTALLERSPTELRCIAVTGDAGIGKSALVAALVEQAEHAPPAAPAWAPIVCRAVARLRTSGLHPFAAATAAPAATGSNPPPASAAHVIAWLDAATGDRLPLLVLEDAHNADDASLDVVARVVERGEPGLVIVTARHGQLPDALATLVHERVHLGPLDPHAIRQLVRAAARPSMLSIAVVDQIVRRSAGVPLYAQELTRASLVAPGEAVPPTLEASLFATLDRLGAAKTTAQHCAVIGTEFDVELAAVVVDETPGVVVHHLDQLVESSVLERVRPAPRPTFRFRHALLEEIAYRSLVRDVRAELHRRLAEESRRTLLPPEALAVHLAAAGRSRDAARQWCHAADAAIARSRFPEAIGHARRALSLTAGDDDVELHALVSLAIASEMTFSGSDEAVAALERAEQLAVSLGRTEYLLFVHPTSIACRQALGDYAGARAAGVAHLMDAARRDDAFARHVIERFHAATLVWMGELDAGARLLEPLLDTVPRHVSTAPEAASSCGVLAIAALVDEVQGRRARAEERFDEAHAIAGAAGAPQASCLTSATHAIARQLAGDAAGVHSFAERTVDTALDLGNDWWFVWGQVLLGWSVATAGDRHSGLAMMREGIDHSGPVVQLRPYFLSLLAEHEAAHGDLDSALGHIAGAVALAERTGEGFFVPELLRVDAVTRSRAGAAANEVAGVFDRAEDVALAQRQPVLRARISAARAAMA